MAGGAGITSIEGALAALLSIGGAEITGALSAGLAGRGGAGISSIEGALAALAGMGGVGISATGVASLGGGGGPGGNGGPSAIKK